MGRYGFVYYAWNYADNYMDMEIIWDCNAENDFSAWEQLKVDITYRLRYMPDAKGSFNDLVVSPIRDDVFKGHVPPRRFRKRQSESIDYFLGTQMKDHGFRMMSIPLAHKK